MNTTKAFLLTFITLIWITTRTFYLAPDMWPWLTQWKEATDSWMTITEKFLRGGGISLLTVLLSLFIRIVLIITYMTIVSVAAFLCLLPILAFGYMELQDYWMLWILQYVFLCVLTLTIYYILNWILTETPSRKRRTRRSEH